VPAPLASCDLDDDDCDDGDDGEPVLHLVVAAAGLPPPRTRGASSIFNLANHLPQLASKLHPRRGPVDGTAAEDRARFYKAERDPGVVRCIGGQYPAGRWTAEREQQEIARRTKQRPPKPTKRYKRKGKKLLDLVGVDG